MNTEYLGVTIEVLVNSLILAILASAVRLLLSDIKDGKDALKIFLGGVIFGVLAAYICNELVMLKGYIRSIIIVASMAGKELYDLIISIVKNPAIIFQIIKAIKEVKTNEKEDKKDVG
jgi:hypothetical protein